MYFICHVTSDDHLIERVCKFMGASSLCYATLLINLVTISITMVVIYFHLSREYMFKNYVNLWVEACHGESPSCHVWWSLV